MNNRMFVVMVVIALAIATLISSIGAVSASHTHAKEKILYYPKNESPHEPIPQFWPGCGGYGCFAP